MKLSTQAARAALDPIAGPLGTGTEKTADGVLAITMPMGDKKLPGIAAEDIGRCAYGIFQRGREYIGKTIGIAGEHLTGAQMASALSKALGQEVVYNNVSPEVYRSFYVFTRQGRSLSPAAEDFQAFVFDYVEARPMLGPDRS